MDKHSHLLGINYLDDRCSVTKTRVEKPSGYFLDSFRGVAFSETSKTTSSWNLRVLDAQEHRGVSLRCQAC
jgi:hypothetical protein